MSVSFLFEPVPNPKNARESITLDPTPLLNMLRLGDGSEGGVDEDKGRDVSRS